MTEQIEYATLYTKQERIRFGVFFIVGTVALFLVANYVLYPQWDRFVSTLHCQTIWGMPGMAALIYGVFIGLPVAAGIAIEVSYAWTGIKTIIEKQSPPKNTKVFKETKIIYGREAVLKGAFMLLVVPALLVPAVSWSYLQAGDFISQIDVNKFDYAICVQQANGF